MALRPQLVPIADKDLGEVRADVRVQLRENIRAGRILQFTIAAAEIETSNVGAWDPLDSPNLEVLVPDRTRWTGYQRRFALDFEINFGTSGGQVRLTTDVAGQTPGQAAVIPSAGWTSVGGLAIQEDVGVDWGGQFVIFSLEANPDAGTDDVTTRILSRFWQFLEY